MEADAATLILTHATSFHKEHWEPVLEDLYDQMADSYVINSPVPKIRDAWAIDSPNHGESAVLNEDTLLSGYTPICKFWAWPYNSNSPLNGRIIQSRGGSMREQYISF
jgi:hypothetical protein